MKPSRKDWKRGFSLVEFTIVIMILGVLSTFAIPRFMHSVERSKAAEAFNYGASVVAAQNHFQNLHGQFASAVASLENAPQAPQYFTVNAPTSGDWHEGWELKLTRNGSSAGYGAYTVVFDQNGFNLEKSSIPGELQPRQ